MLKHDPDRVEGNLTWRSTKQKQLRDHQVSSGGSLTQRLPGTARTRTGMSGGVGAGRAILPGDGGMVTFNPSAA